MPQEVVRRATAVSSIAALKRSISAREMVELEDETASIASIPAATLDIVSPRPYKIGGLVDCPHVEVIEVAQNFTDTKSTFQNSWCMSALYVPIRVGY